MKIKSMDIKNYRNFSELHVDLDPRLTVFVGINGSGKTTILDALAILLKMIAASHLRFPSESVISLKDVRIENTNESEIALDSQILYTFFYENDGKESVNYTIYHKEQSSDYNQCCKITDINNRIKHNVKPIVVSYGSKRVINTHKHPFIAHSEAQHAFQNAFDAAIDFPSTLTWFIEKSSEEAMKGKRKGDLEFTIPELAATKKAVCKALGDYNEPYVDKTPPELFIEPKSMPNVQLRIEQLSDGYRTMLALVMDLARRMALAAQEHKNKFNNSLEYPGIVLIDEVELHLHPAWQQSVLTSLLSIFPNTQFIVTTHSPQIVSSIEPDHLRILDQNQVYLPSSSTYGAESQRVLKEIFGVDARYAESDAKKALDTYFKLINEGEYESEQARECRQKLDKWLLGDPALDSADMLIRRAQRIRERGASNA